MNPRRRHAAGPATAKAPEPQAASAAPATAKPRKLSYKEQRELDALPALIDALEAEQREIGAQLGGSEIYQGDPALLVRAQDRYAQIEAELMAALERWETLGAA